MQIFFTRMDGSFLVDLDTEARCRAATFLRDATSEGMPFLLSEDGEYLEEVNAWLRSLPQDRVASPNSWKAYARDVRDFGSFLEARGVPLWEATEEDLDSYHRFRRMGEDRIDPGSWARAMAAIDRLYTWAVARKIIKAKSFDATRIREKGAATSDIQFLSRDDYLFFRDVGLRGLLPDGTEDPTSRVENVERNALFADLLVTTGLRCSEGAYALVSERPARSQVAGVHHERWLVPAGLGKGGRERYTLVPVRVLRALDEYVNVERALVVQEAREAGRYEDPALRLVDRVNRDRARDLVTRGWINIREARAPSRSRLLLLTAGEVAPLAIFLGQDGLPVAQKTWESLFARASSRCERFGRPLHVTPHVLRHTYATLSLTEWLRRHIAVNGNASGALASYVTAPLRRLQRRMGHTQIMTTWKYLDLVGDLPNLLDEALFDLDVPGLDKHLPEPYLREGVA